MLPGTFLSRRKMPQRLATRGNMDASSKSPLRSPNAMWSNWGEGCGLCTKPLESWCGLESNSQGP